MDVKTIINFHQVVHVMKLVGNIFKIYLKCCQEIKRG